MTGNYQNMVKFIKKVSYNYLSEELQIPQVFKDEAYQLLKEIGEVFIAFDPALDGGDRVAVMEMHPNGRAFPHDAVNHPAHYTQGDARCRSCDSPIECIDVTEHMNFNLGNAVKYIWRADMKGNRFQDLEKAQWYINREVERSKDRVQLNVK